MNGGSASLSTTSGSLILRGDYARASVRSAIGRIDLALPPSRIEPVDVRARNSEEHFVIEVQHRPEVLFPHRAVLYGAAEVLAQHATKSATRATASACAQCARSAACSWASACG